MDNEQDKNKQQPQRFERRPNFDCRAKLSKDGRYWIIERIETWILPRKYFDVIAQSHGLQTPGSENSEPETKTKRRVKRDAHSNG